MRRPRRSGPGGGWWSSWGPTGTRTTVQRGALLRGALDGGALLRGATALCQLAGRIDRETAHTAFKDSGLQ
jgi:hypothetical protein